MSHTFGEGLMRAVIREFSSWSVSEGDVAV
jgi:hypothetical protein